MQKQKTITVNTCDFCINEDRETRKCDHCGKDFCAWDGRSWLIESKLPERQRAGITHFFNDRQMQYTAHVCNDCAKHELSTVLVRFGFQSFSSKTENVA